MLNYKFGARTGSRVALTKDNPALIFPRTDAHGSIEAVMDPALGHLRPKSSKPSKVIDAIFGLPKKKRRSFLLCNCLQGAPRQPAHPFSHPSDSLSVVA